MKGNFYGVGIGPGDPRMITLKAADILKHADAVAVPKTGEGKDSLALSIAENVIDKDKEILDLIFPMTNNGELLQKSRKIAENKITKELDRGKNVALITLGDPTIYSTCMYIYEAMEARGYNCELVAGITSFCASAARAGISLSEGKQSFAVIPSVADMERLGEMLLKFDTIIIMKCSLRFEELKKKLKDENLFDKVVLVEKCGLFGEKVIYDLDSLSAGELSYFSTIIIKNKATGRSTI